MASKANNKSKALQIDSFKINMALFDPFVDLVPSRLLAQKPVKSSPKLPPGHHPDHAPLGHALNGDQHAAYERGQLQGY